MKQTLWPAVSTLGLIVAVISSYVILPREYSPIFVMLITINATLWMIYTEIRKE
jgi:hypothetical protein